MPRVLRRQHANSRLTYRILPFKRYGQPILADSEGAMLQNKMIPFGVDGGTRSRAAERIITYRTRTCRFRYVVHSQLAHTIVEESEEKE
jgi:hypothetical protein